MGKGPRFFCDNCGAEVGAGIDRCPGCGRYFSAIRCPKCGFSGDESAFRGGCPSCGYSSKALSRIKKRPRGAAKGAAGETWLYLVATALFLLVLSLFIFKLR
jgi:predicted RNA-binding Zn-ribbon protein involved in translation (DUF1610 family)